MYKSQCNTNDPYDWLYGQGSHIITIPEEQQYNEEYQNEHVIWSLTITLHQPLHISIMNGFISIQSRIFTWTKHTCSVLMTCNHLLGLCHCLQLFTHQPMLDGYMFNINISATLRESRSESPFSDRFSELTCSVKTVPYCCNFFTILW